MKLTINKKFIKQIILAFSIILYANYFINFATDNFSEKGYQKYYQNSEIDVHNEIHHEQALIDLFTHYKPSINTKDYPKTYQEYLKSNKNKNTLFFTLDHYTDIYSSQTSEEIESRKEIIKLLDKTKSKHTKQNIETKLYPFENSRLFFNRSGDLIFIQQEQGSNTFYRYDISGKLLEAEWYNGNEVNLVYTPDKQLKYMFYRSFSNNYQKYRINYKQYCNQLHVKIILSSIKILLAFITCIFFKNLIFTKNIDEKYLQEFTEKKSFLQKYKTNLWSHILASLGWIYLYQYITNINKPLADFYLIIIFILSLLGLIILTPIILLKKTKIQWQFIYENKLYNIFWNTGIIATFIFIMLILINLIC